MKRNLPWCVPLSGVPDGKKIAYYRFDESEVPQFNMTMYRGQLYPYDYTFKYPKVGEVNSQVSIWIYDRLVAGKCRRKPVTGNTSHASNGSITTSSA